MDADPALIEDLKSHLNKPTPTAPELAELQRMLNAAVAHVEARAGVRAVFPPDLRLATLIIAGHLWETQRVPQPGGGGPIGFGGDGAPGGFSAGYGVPNRAMDLMMPYLLGRSPVWSFDAPEWTAR